MTTIPIAHVTAEDLRAEKAELEARAGMSFDELSQCSDDELTRAQVDILFRLEGVVEMLRLEG
ncbi:hypothetical protein [Nesterenkonia sp. PF2B19]|uniref:hypothetical protein n=1 Tax=Nesterenkonia sp. PF2B19 TaxID=1881858 RepID=UPI000872232D|nr:hypothetical protein [Nesterenkonia sp. PF2B19]OSM44623.1 hypothetical protein BCY76_001660 [Nesterenkonia sp. PF2B19]